MLTHCDFIYAGESAQFQMPFINLAVVPEFGSSCSVPARIGHVRAAELILLGAPFDAKRAAELGLVTQVVSDKDVLARATETAGKLAAKPAAALQASKRLMKQPFREQIKAAMKAENEEFSAQVRSEDAKEAFTAFLEKRKPDFSRRIKSPATANIGTNIRSRRHVITAKLRAPHRSRTEWPDRNVSAAAVLTVFWSHPAASTSRHRWSPA